jgi:predicted dehydrogenase
MLKVGIVGTGFMGWIHYLAYRKVPGVKIAAICDKIPHRLAGDWTDIKGNFGPQGEKIDVSEIRTFTDLEEMAAWPELDLIDICLPPFLHADAAVAGLRGGKHVFCEKPMSLTTGECDRMVEASRAAGRQLFIGHVLPFFPEFAYARQVIASGEYGRLLGGNFKRVISDPMWLKDFYDPKRVGGPMLDLHVHDAHFIRLLFGMPAGVTTQGRIRGEVVDYFDTLFHYDDPSIVVRATSGVINQQGREFTHGFEIHLERATLHFEFAGFKDGPEVMPLKVLAADGQVIRPQLGDGDPVRGFEGEIAEVVRCVQNGQPSAILSGDLARDAVVMCHRQTESARERHTVKI